MRHILNIAHRGFHKTFPDNTMEAFEAAIQIGVDGIELDVQESADNKFIVFHDDKLRGIDIRNLTLDEVNNIKLQNKFRIPSLPQVLELCLRQTSLFIELKKVWSLDKFLSLLKSRGKPKNIVVISFHKDLVSRCQRLAPDIRTGIVTALPFRDRIKAAKSAQCNNIIVMFPFVNSILVDNAHASNLSVFIWGCPDLRASRKVLRLPIDGMISDFPELIKDELQRKQACN